MQLGYGNSLIGQNRPLDSTPGGTADVWLWETGIGLQWETGIFMSIE